MDPKVARFLQKHALSEREAVQADVERYKGRSLEELGKEITVVCSMAAEILDASPEKARILAFREPPHESYFRLIRQMKLKNPASTAKAS